jgi:hypothetical protein
MGCCPSERGGDIVSVGGDKVFSVGAGVGGSVLLEYLPIAAKSDDDVFSIAIWILPISE